MFRRFLTLIAAITMLYPCPAAENPPGERPRLILNGEAARVTIDLAGGSIAEFRLSGSDLNPLSWAAPLAGDVAIRGMGHFLCLDRWGPPSEAEGSRGMPYHGEASNVKWAVSQEPHPTNGTIEGQVTAKLPKAGLSVRRTIRLANEGAVFTVLEEVTNDNALGRIYNMVQHPSIAPPFLDETTIVDCNGRKGFAQGGSLPNPESPSADWPHAINKEGNTVDLRYLKSDPNPNVVSYAIDDTFGWLTAATPAKGLLIGYFWRTNDYPWVSLWRDVRDGKPVARGLEFGTTGLHQPFPILVKKGRIWERPLFDYLDAGETTSKSYSGFLLKIPADYSGTESVKIERDRIVITEAKDKARTFVIPRR